MICYDIARTGLRKCYSTRGILAGLHQFSDYWARDSLWACLGAMRLGDYAIVRKTLDLFLKHEREGMIPIRIGRPFILSYMGFKGERKNVRYGEDKNGNEVSDSSSLFVIVGCRYYHETSDEKFFTRFKPVARKIVERHGLLIKESYYSTWMDAIKKSGFIFYSNILYHQAIKEFLRIESDKKLQDKVKDQASEIRRIFWNGEFFIDWHDGRAYEYLDTFANLLAIYFGFARSNEKRKIFSKIKARKGFIAKSYPDYDEGHISRRMKLIWMKGYCSRIWYPWMNFFYCMCLGDRDLLKRLCQLVERDRAVHECYDFRANPYRNLIYFSEHPFAWACSFAILALEKN